MAIGVARMLGFTVPENFALPFASITPSIFWTRWHMSLSFWIRDYVFMPLAMLSPAQWWWEFSLLMSMVIFGVWHKGTLLYLLFGCYQGILLIGHRRVQATRKRFKSLMRKLAWGPAFSWFLTTALIALGWIFFRANSLTQAFAMFRAVLTPASYGDRFLPSSLYLLVGVLAIGYALTVIVTSALDRYSSSDTNSALRGHHCIGARSMDLDRSDLLVRVACRLAAYPSPSTERSWPIYVCWLLKNLAVRCTGVCGFHV